MTPSSDPIVTIRPVWFRDALASPVREAYADVEGCGIHYLSWGDPTKPGILFVPGSGGHVHWFSFLAPLLADQFHVVAMEFGGMGDSKRRDIYDSELLREEIIGVAHHAGMTDSPIKPIVVGHSLGGQFALRCMFKYADAFLGVMAFDTVRQGLMPTDPLKDFVENPQPPRTEQPKRFYPDKITAAARFRLRPEPAWPCRNQFILDHIAAHSVREDPGGWTWKFDPAAMSMGGPGLELLGQLKDIRCRLAIVYGKHTFMVDEKTVETVSRASPPGGVVMQMDDAGHYPFLDQPLASVALIKALASAWIADATNDPRAGQRTGDG